MEKGNVNGAFKLLPSNISNGILDETLTFLKQKHPASSELNEQVLLRREKPSVHPVVFEDIDESMVKEAALETKGCFAPSGLDTVEWKKILVSKNYRTINTDLRRTFDNAIKQIYTEKLPVDTTKDETPLEAFLACRLIPFDKNLGLQKSRFCDRMKLGVYSYAQIKRQDVKPLYVLCTNFLNPAKKRR